MSDTERASRQELVVPPRQSNLPVILGACVCGCAGFGLVWGLGIGRSSPAPLPPDVTAATVETAAPTPSEGWRPPATDPDEQPETDRYPNRPVSFETAAGVVPTGGTDRGLSRFSAPADLEPLPEAAATDLLPATADDEPPGDDISPPVPESDDSEPAAIDPAPTETDLSTAEPATDDSAASPAVDEPVGSRFTASTDLEPLEPLAEPVPMTRDTAPDSDDALATPPAAAQAPQDTTAIAKPATDLDPPTRATPRFDEPADEPLASAGANATAAAATTGSGFAAATANTTPLPSPRHQHLPRSRRPSSRPLLQPHQPRSGRRALPALSPRRSHRSRRRDCHPRQSACPISRRCAPSQA
jgi:hypothetical protein